MLEHFWGSLCLREFPSYVNFSSVEFTSCCSSHPKPMLLGKLQALFCLWGHRGAPTVLNGRRNWICRAQESTSLGNGAAVPTCPGVFQMPVSAPLLAPAQSIPTEAPVGTTHTHTSDRSSTQKDTTRASYPLYRHHVLNNLGNSKIFWFGIALYF